MRRVHMSCLFCGLERDPLDFWWDVRRKTCIPCNRKNNREALAAIAEVSKQVKRGLMLRAAAFGCSDCDKPASVYDHRDYTEPLKVAPVCRACNVRRGHAFNSFYRPESAHVQPAQAA